MKYCIAVLAICILAGTAGCKKDPEDVQPGQLTLRISHTLGGQPLIYDSIMYRNESGELYSISRLYYYISNIRFYRQGQAVFSADSVWYIDAQKPPHERIFLWTDAFRYDSVSYYIGIPPAYNQHGLLEATYENIAMEWPEPMGGGYHFLKLEGHWKEDAGTPGFTVHLGTDAYLVKGGFRTSGEVNASAGTSLTLEMDIQEWFKNPYTYSFERDGSYTMGIGELMRKLSENGRDVFHIKSE